MKRQQVKQKADGRVVLPSAEAWDTPDRMCVTPGLRAAVCDAMLEQSVRKTAARVAERAAEKDLLSAAECLKIVHEEGERLQAAQQQRAALVFEKDSQGRRLLPITPDSREANADEDSGPAEVLVDAEAETAADATPSAPWGFPGSVAAAEFVAAAARGPRLCHRRSGRGESPRAAANGSPRHLGVYDGGFDGVAMLAHCGRQRRSIDLSSDGLAHGAGSASGQKRAFVLGRRCPLDPRLV